MRGRKRGERDKGRKKEREKERLGDAIIVVTQKSEPSAHGPSGDLWPCPCLILDEPLAFYRPI